MDFAVRIVKLYKYLTFEKKRTYYQSNCFAPEHRLEPICMKLKKHSPTRNFSLNSQLH